MFDINIPLLIKDWTISSCIVLFLLKVFVALFAKYSFSIELKLLNIFNSLKLVCSPSWYLNSSMVLGAFSLDSIYLACISINGNVPVIFNISFACKYSGIGIYKGLSGNKKYL